MKRFYPTIMMLAMMVAALNFTSCSKDDDDKIDGGGDYDDTEYCEIVINGEDYTTDFYGGGILANLASREKNGKEVFAYGGLTDMVKISQYDGIQFHIIAGYVSEDMQTVFPNPTGNYDVISNRGEYIVSDYSERVGMTISGGNMNRRTVTSGSLKITKVNKYEDTYNGNVYATEGTFSFILTDDWDGNENKISGKFRILF
jgi:hypothetical protein